MKAKKPNNFILDPRHAQRIKEGLASYELIFRAEIIEQIIPELLEDATIKGNEQKDPLILIRQQLDEQIRNLLKDSPHKISQLFAHLLEEEKLFEQDSIAATSQQLCDDFFDRKIGFDEAIAKIQTIREHALNEVIVLNQGLGEGDPEKIAQAQVIEMVFANAKDSNNRNGNFFNRSTGRALINGNLLFRNSLQKWFAKIGKEIKSDDKTAIASELIKRIGLEEDPAVTPQNIIALSEGDIIANRHLAKCLTAAITGDVLRIHPVYLQSRANFYSFATSENQNNSQVIEATLHPTTYPFGPKILALKERFWQMRIENPNAFYATDKKDIRNFVIYIELPYLEQYGKQFPNITSTDKIDLLKHLVEDIYHEDWQSFKQNYYLPALWEHLPKREKIVRSFNAISEIENPYVFINLYLKTVSGAEREKILARLDVKFSTLSTVKSAIENRFLDLGNEKNTWLREYFSEHIKDPELFGIDKDYLDRLFPVHTPESSILLQNEIEQEQDFKILINLWSKIIGLNNAEFCLYVSPEQKDPNVTFFAWSLGAGLDKRIGKICDILREKTKDNPALPQFTVEAEEQLRSAAIIKQQEFNANGRERRAIRKAEKTSLCTTKRIKPSMNLGLGDKDSLEH